MHKTHLKQIFIASLVCLFACNHLYANDVTILAADFNRTQENTWSVNVTLEHADSGWDHYADGWRIVDKAGKVLGTRELLHPHEDEQPFTRGLSNVQVPSETSTLFVEAHDSVHGWTPNRLEIDMSKAVEGHLKVESNK